jgi:hypothetical protein
LGKDIFEALMDRVNVTLGAHKMISPNLKSVNNSYQLKIMGWIILFMIPECSGCISNDPVVLHKNTTKSGSGSITIDIERLGTIWLS